MRATTFSWLTFRLVYLAALIMRLAVWVMEQGRPIKPGEYRVTELGKKQIVRGVLPQ
jgi:hypothetical protein